METTETTQTERQEKARTIKHQIGLHTLMALGAHDFNVPRIGNIELNFKISGVRSTWFFVELDESLDLYNVRMIQRKGSKTIKLDYAKEIYAESLADTLRNLFDHATK